MHGFIRKRITMTGTELFIHPSILFIAGAFLIPFLWGNVRKVFLLLIPALALIIVASTAQGTYGSFEFLGREIIFGNVKKRNGSLF